MAHPSAVAKLDAEWQQRIGEELSKACTAFEAGELDGLYIVTKRRDEAGRPLLHYQRAAMMDVDVSWAAIAMALSVHLDHAETEPSS